MKQSGHSAGPLHGLPVSIKDSFQVKEIPATLGLVSYLDHQSDSNSAIVEMLLDLGAVLYCKTNVPQTLMVNPTFPLLTTSGPLPVLNMDVYLYCLQAGESHNHVFGRTLNPWNTTLSPGGSTGGEGALIAMRGSPIGMGTDMAGKINSRSLLDVKDTDMRYQVPSESQHSAVEYTDSDPPRFASQT